MSLTSFIKQDTVADGLARHFPVPRGSPGVPIQQRWQSSNYSLVGTAYDYLLRFWLARTISTVHTRPNWVAETGVRLLSNRPYGDDELVEHAERVIEEGREERDAYIEGGDLKKRLIELTMDLSRLDWVYRNGEAPTGLGEYDQRDVVDLRQLIELLDRKQPLQGDEVYLNPTFGAASDLVGGADADVLLDQTLIDVKVTKSEKLKRSWWLQLAGYAILVDIYRTLEQQREIADGETAHPPLPPVEKLGVYFARHGELWTTPVSQVYDYGDYEAVRAWFVDKALGPRDSTETADTLRETFCSPYEYADIPNRAHSEGRAPAPSSEDQSTFGDFTE